MIVDEALKSGEPVFSFKPEDRNILMFNNTGAGRETIPVGYWIYDKLNIPTNLLTLRKKGKTMSNDHFLKAVNDEIEKVREEHSKMHGSVQIVNDQHAIILNALRRVEKEHDVMNRDLQEIKDMLSELIAR